MTHFIDVILQLGLFAKTIVILLIILSFISWAIIVDKLLKNRRIRRESKDFFNLFTTFRSYQDISSLSREFQHSPYPRIIRSLQKYLDKDKTHSDTGDDKLMQNGSIRKLITNDKSTRLQSFLDGTITKEISDMEKHLIFLSTTVSVSPFLGLLGTVWGIMSAFLSMGLRGSADIAAVGPGIAEALVTTIAGLAVAIPALIGYNFFVDRIRREEDRISIFSREVVQLIESEDQ